jgi:hypothetical protein
MNNLEAIHMSSQALLTTLKLSMLVLAELPKYESGDKQQLSGSEIAKHLF